MRKRKRLVVVSNRVPALSAGTTAVGDRANPVGGLVSAVKPVLEDAGGLWFGWSGKTTQRRADESPAVVSLGSNIQLATIDLSEDEVNLYYTGFANRTLWPLLHSFTERVVVRHDTYRAYRRINRRFAEALFPLLEPDDLIWVHDFHLFHLGWELRRLGWNGKVGFFLHVPFPSADVFSVIPWSRPILEALLHYDLVGVHTDRYLRNLDDTLRSQLEVEQVDGVYSTDGLSSRLGSYAIGIDPTAFQRDHGDTDRGLADELRLSDDANHKLILGVDRLDYTKGIPTRIRAFERLLEHHPSLRGRVTLVQVSAPSRSRVPEYRDEKQRVDMLVGQVNGRFSEAGWVPIRSLYRSYPQHELARFYHDAHVAMVTPLRDGMNLVAKEFVAAQGEDPGVLVLSRFSGAASSMDEALIVNPYDVDGTAEATYQALRMPEVERRRRWRALMEVVEGETAWSWGESFTRDLETA